MSEMPCDLVKLGVAGGPFTTRPPTESSEDSAMNDCIGVMECCGFPCEWNADLAAWICTYRGHHRYNREGEEVSDCGHDRTAQARIAAVLQLCDDTPVDTVRVADIRRVLGVSA